jgi:hypothetical protein
MDSQLHLIKLKSFGTNEFALAALNASNLYPSKKNKVINNNKITLAIPNFVFVIISLQLALKPFITFYLFFIHFTLK